MDFAGQTQDLRAAISFVAAESSVDPGKTAWENVA